MHEGGGRWVGSNKLVELKKKESYENNVLGSLAVWDSVKTCTSLTVIIVFKNSLLSDLDNRMNQQICIDLSVLFV